MSQSLYYILKYFLENIKCSIEKWNFNLICDQIICIQLEMIDKKSKQSITY